MHYPRQRRLDDATKAETAKMLAMKANKKRVQQHILESTGQVILLKDLHNISAR